MTVTITLAGVRGGQGTSTTAAALALLAGRRCEHVELVAHDLDTTAALLGLPGPVDPDDDVAVTEQLTLRSEPSGTAQVVIIDAGPLHCRRSTPRRASRRRAARPLLPEPARSRHASGTRTRRDRRRPRERAEPHLARRRRRHRRPDARGNDRLARGRPHDRRWHPARTRATPHRSRAPRPLAPADPHRSPSHPRDRARVDRDRASTHRAIRDRQDRHRLAGCAERNRPRASRRRVSSSRCA